jgi:hypothetical protein
MAGHRRTRRMPLHYEFHRHPGFVRFDAAGEASLQDIKDLVDDVETRTRQAGDRRVLVDLTRVQENLKFTDHYAIGELVARRLAHLERLASLVPQARRTGTSEKVANAQGPLLRVFVDEPAAIAWLHEAQPSPLP